MWSLNLKVGGLGDAGLAQRFEAPMYRPPFQPNMNRRFERTTDAKRGGSGGMSGSANEGSMKIILSAIATVMGSGYEIVDIGAGSGIVLACAFAFGALWAVGMELKKDGQAHVWDLLVDELAQHGILRGQASVEYGVNLRSLDHLPTLQGPGGQVHKAVFAFCDGWDQEDRAHMFRIVGKDANVKMFIASPGKVSGDWYLKHEEMLKDLNLSASQHRCAEFRHQEAITVVMFVSGDEKTLHIFTR